MITQYYLNHTENQKVFVTSDTHFFHDKSFIINPRGFDEVFKHNDWIINNWNSRVGRNDIVIHLGDFLVGSKNPMKDGEEILSRLNGEIYHIWGNHNSFVKKVYEQEVKKLFPSSDEYIQVYPICYKNLKFLGNSANFKIKIDTDEVRKTIRFFASHYCHRVWNESHKGQFMISGHSHGTDKLCNPDAFEIKGLDVGIDNFPNLLDVIELDRIMEKKEVAYTDHHNKSTT